MQTKAQKPKKTANPEPASPENEIDVQRLWEKYEDIAMHFNGLLIKLRTQSLAFVVAISTFIGIFAKGGGTGISTQTNLMGYVFLGLLVIWIAIFFLDYCYYNKLLQGAVNAILALEHKTEENKGHTIDLSTKVENTFKSDKKSSSSVDNEVTRSFGGVIIFYCLVAFVLLAAALFFFCRTPEKNTPPDHISPTVDHEVSEFFNT